jgi:putative flippase GtrA
MILLQRIQENKYFPTLIHIIYYGMFGCVSAIVDILIFKLICSITPHYLLANLISYSSGSIVSFTLNRSYTFKVKNKIVKRIILFYTASGLGFLASSITIFILVNNLKLIPLYAKLISVIIVFIIQFSFNKLITFKETSH